MNHRKIFLIYFIIILLTTGCGLRYKGETEIKKPDIAPKSLQDINKGVEDILVSASNIEKIDLDIVVDEEIEDDKEEEKKESEDFPSGENQEDQGNEDEEDKNDENNKKNEDIQGKDLEEDGSKQNVASKAEKIAKIWESIDTEIGDIYSAWHTYEVEGMKKGVTRERGSEFESSLNRLTKAIENKSITEIYDYGSQTLKKLKPFYDLYSDELRGDINQIKYFVFQYYVNAISDNRGYNISQNFTDEESINRLRSKLEEDKGKLESLDEINLALENLNRSSGEDSRRLYIIKKDTLIEKLKELEE